MNMFSKKEKAAASTNGRNGANGATATATPPAPAPQAPTQPQQSQPQQPQMQANAPRQAVPQPVPAPMAQNRQPITVIGKGTLIEGNIETANEFVIEGQIKGDIITQSKVILGPSSQFEGNILAQNAEIAGHVIGKVEVSELLVLKTSSDVNGDISTNKLHVESGAKFNGGCQMGVTREAIKLSADSSQPAANKSTSSSPAKPAAKPSQPATGGSKS